jgi:SAM-dependent methyltransferase
MLEIGVADPRFPGASAQMWRDYFPDLYFVGYDINPEAKKYENVADYVHIFIGDQNNPEDLQRCIDEHGGEFDIILDDGSHYSEHILTSFENLFQHLKPEGYYVIEDLHSVYTNASVTLPKIDEIIERKNFKLEKVETGNYKLLIMKKGS